MTAYILPNGNWLIPARAESKGVLGDGMLEVPAGHPEAKKWAAWYKRQGKRPPRRPQQAKEGDS